MMQATIQMTPSRIPLPELEVPMIRTMVTCLGIGHRKLYGLNMQLAFAAKRLACDARIITANQQALQAWDKFAMIYGRICKSKMSGCCRGAWRTRQFHARCSTL
jgi:hypothetical protein